MLIAAHPDDEILGCGGTLLYFKKKKYEVKVIFLSDGESSRIGNQQKSLNFIKKRESQAIKVSKLARFQKPVFARFEDNKLDTVPLLKIVKFVEKQILDFKPSIIFTHNEHDLNIDHTITFRAVLTATRPSTKTFVNTIYCFETPSSTENNFSYIKTKYNPNIFFDISKHINKKIKLVQVYGGEIKKQPHPRSIRKIKTLAEYRGSQIGKKYAEAFYLLRKINY